MCIGQHCIAKVRQNALQTTHKEKKAWRDLAIQIARKTHILKMVTLAVKKSLLRLQNTDSKVHCWTSDTGCQSLFPTEISYELQSSTMQWLFRWESFAFTSPFISPWMLRILAHEGASTVLKIPAYASMCDATSTVKLHIWTMLMEH